LDRIVDLRDALPAERAAIPVAGRPQSTPRVTDPHAIAFLTLVNDETQYATSLRYLDALQVPPEYAVERVAVFGATSMAEGYQRAMEASTARYKIYIHQDVYLIHRGLLPELVNLFRTHPRLGLVGVVGATRFPPRGIWWVNNALYCYGRLWEYFRPGGFPASVYIRRRAMHFSRFRSFTGDYLPAAAVDGLFIATQYDLPWVDALGGFELYDQVHALEFIKAGFEVGIARQESIWCIHWGPPQERTPEQRAPREVALHRRAGVFRQLNRARIGVPARTLYEQHRGAITRMILAAGEDGDGGPPRHATPTDSPTPAVAQERLGVVIAAANGPEWLLRALRALLPQCDEVQKVEYRVVVAAMGSTDATVEAVRREFPQVTVLTSAADAGLPCTLNSGLRALDFPSYVLVTHDDVELATGTVDTMVSYLRAHPQAAGVIPTLANRDGTVQRQRIGIVDPAPRRPRGPRMVTFVDTTCALVRGTVFFDVGLYDERFPTHYADLDWSVRGRRKGYTFAFLPEARVILHHRAAAGRDGPAAVAESLVADLRFLYKHRGRRWAKALYAAQRLRARWLAFRWRHDVDALRQLNEAVVQLEGLSRKMRDENRSPQLL
jgi:GT2 family glycosyltransferase